MKRDSFPVGLTGIFGLLLLYGAVQLNYGADILRTTGCPDLNQTAKKRTGLPDKPKATNVHSKIWRFAP